MLEPINTRPGMPHAPADAPPPQNDPVFVSEVIGTGPNAHRIVRVGEWSLRVPGAAGTEPEIPDTDLAPRLGMQIHKLRELSGRYERGGDIHPRVEVSPAVGGTPESQRNPGGRPARRRFYNEADALFLVTRSEAPKAVALTKEMIGVYMLARRGLLPQQQKPIDVEHLRRVVREEIEGARLPRDGNVADYAGALTPRQRGRYLRGLLLDIARAYAAQGPKERSVRSWRSFVDVKVRQAAGFPAGPSGAFEMMDAQQWNRALLAALAELETAKRLQPGVEDAQLALGLKKVPR